jgi:subtilisin family serine protease
MHGWMELNPHRIAAFTTFANDEVTLTVPGTAPDVITVGATKIDDLMIPFENSSLGPTRGRLGCEKPVIMAPGVGIRTAKAGSSDLLDDQGVSGTSYAAPHVAGAIALMLSARVSSNAPQLNTSQIQVALRRSAKHYTGRWSGTTGYGELDVAALLGELNKI